MPTIPFLGELPHLEPIYGHADAFTYGKYTGIGTGIAAGIFIGNVAAGANGLVACGTLAQKMAIGYTVTAATLGMANATVNIVNTGEVSLSDALAFAPVIGFGLGKLSGLRSCFFAGTPVATEHGDRPIETIQAGDRVWSFSLTANEWRLCTVSEKFASNYSDRQVNVFVAGERIAMTHDHPFWVSHGEKLDARPIPEHIATATVKDAVVQGRWVAASDLRVGDMLLLMDGRQAPIEQIQILDAKDVVYNFAVDPLHTYAVGHAHVLVHNSACDPNAIEFHHLLSQSKKLAPFLKNAGLDIEKFKIPLTTGAHRLKAFNGIHTGPNNWNAVWKQFFTLTCAGLEPLATLAMLMPADAVIR